MAVDSFNTRTGAVVSVDGDYDNMYARLGGLSGGQTLKGDTASGGNLTLMSTDHATKGKILLGTSAYDEVNTRLGIGTQSPGSPLHIQSDSVYIQAGLEFCNNTNLAARLDFLRAKGSVTTKVAVEENSDIGTINFWGFASGGYYGTGLIKSVVDGAISGTVIPGRLQFHTANSSGGVPEIMRITSDGKVGIGTQPPSETLDIQKPTASMRLRSSSDANANFIMDSGDTASQTCQVILKDRGTDKFQIRKRSDNALDILRSGQATPDFFIGTDGKVGIGTTTPGQVLDVVGNIAVSGTVDGVDVSAHAGATVSVHNFDASGNAPAQSHDNSRHSTAYEPAITTLPVSKGGIGLSTIAAGGILYASALDTLSRIAPTAANQVLRSTAANALEIAALVAADIPELAASKITSGVFGVARGGTGLSTVSLGDILYASATDTLARLAANATATRKFLMSVNSAIPSYEALLAGDIPNHNQAWSTITSTPTTLAGYGITDAAPSSHTTDANVHSGATTIMGIAKTNFARLDQANNFGAYNLTVDTNVLYVDAANDRVGIGTTSPEAKADIIGDQQGTVTSYGSEVPGLILEQRHAASGITYGPMLEFRMNNGTDIWTNAAIVGIDNSGYSGELAFLTQPGGTTDPSGRRTKGANLVERMRINKDGKVGIGTTDPSKYGTFKATGSPVLRIKSSTNQAPAIIRIGGDAASPQQGDGVLEVGGAGYFSATQYGWTTGIGMNLVTQYNGTSDIFLTPITHGSVGYQGIFCKAGGNIEIYNATGATTAGAEVTPTARLAITSDGKIGIGTTSPGYILDVQASAATQRIKSTGSNPAYLIIAGGSSQYSQIIFRENDTDKWYVAKHDDNIFGIRYGASSAAFRILTDSTVRLGSTYYWDIDPSTGDLVPSADKTHMIGSGTKRVERIYTDGTISGCGRYIKTRIPCSKCGESTYRSTPSPTIGEGFDFGMVFCNSCGAVSVEKFNHLPKENLSSIRPAPSIYLKRLKVTGTGHTRIASIMYEYKDDKGNTWNNTTHFSDDELDDFLKMDDAEKKAFLRKIGEREWQSLEETRIMGEYSKELESKLDSFNLAGVCLNQEKERNPVKTGGVKKSGKGK